MTYDERAGPSPFEQTTRRSQARNTAAASATHGDPHRRRRQGGAERSGRAALPEGLPHCALPAQALTQAVRRCCHWRRWTARSGTSKRRSSAFEPKPYLTRGPRNQRRAVGRRGHRRRRAERRRLRSLPDRRRRRRAAADAVHRSDARRQDVRFPPSRVQACANSSVRSRLLVRGCEVASAPAAVTPAPTAKKARLDDAATVSPPGCAPYCLCSSAARHTNSVQLRPCTAFLRGACSPSRR